MSLISSPIQSRTEEIRGAFRVVSALLPPGPWRRRATQTHGWQIPSPESPTRVARQGSARANMPAGVSRPYCPAREDHGCDETAPRRAPSTRNRFDRFPIHALKRRPYSMCPSWLRASKPNRHPRAILPHRHMYIHAPAPRAPRGEAAPAPNSVWGRSAARSGLHLETPPAVAGSSGFARQLAPAFRRIFFKLLLGSGIMLRMAGVRGHLAPAVPGQYPINRRRGHAAAQTPLQSLVNRRHDQHATRFGFFNPGLKKPGLLFDGKMLAPAATPRSSSSRSPRNLIANLFLHPNHGRNADPQHLTRRGICNAADFGNNHTQTGSQLPGGICLFHKLPGYLHHVIADDRWSGHFLLALLCSWREWVGTSRSIYLNHLDCNLE